MRIKMSEHPVVDAAALGVIAGAWLQIIPAIAAVFAILWYCILIWESDTMCGWTGRKLKQEKIDDQT
jgi:hypothetical protein